MSTAPKPASSPATLASPDWVALRREFPTTERFVYLDIARKAILPRCVEQTMQAWTTDVYEQAGARAFSMDVVEETRAKVARVFGAPADTIALIKNTSEGISIAAQGLGLRPGDNVVINESEHENNTFPWRHLASRGVEVRLARPDNQGRITADSYRPLVDARTRVLSTAWVTYGLGCRVDVAALAELARSVGAVVVVDGIQAIGVLATPLQDLGADIIVSGGHKAQFSLAGAGLMYVRKDVIGEVTPPYAAKYSFVSNDRTQAEPQLAPDSHRFEYGNPNFLGVWVQGRSAEFVESIGLAQIEARVCELTTGLMQRADAAGIPVRTPRPWHERAGIVTFDLGGKDEPIAEALRKRDIVVSLKDGYLRAAVHFFNNEDDLEQLVEAVSGLLPKPH